MGAKDKTRLQTLQALTGGRGGTLDAPGATVASCVIDSPPPSSMPSSPRILLDNAADKLPSPNGVALAIMDLWEKEETTVEQLARLIETDPALCGRLLRLANSSLMGSRPVAAVPEAIVRVGMRTVGHLAVTFSLIDNALEGQCEEFDYPGFWSQSLLMAVLSKGVAEATRVAAPDDLFACGLLARVGELALATIYPREFGAILREAGPDPARRIRQEFGFDHNDVTLELMLDYGVPEVLAGPARFHQETGGESAEPGTRKDRLIDAFRLAYQLARLTSVAEHERPAVTRHVETLRERLALATEQVAAIFDAAVSDWHDWSRMLELGAEFGGDYASTADVEGSAEAVDVVDDACPPAVAGSPHRAALVGCAERLGVFTRALEAAGFELRACDDYVAARRLAVGFLPQLLLVDAAQGAVDVQQFCRLVRATDWGRAIYIVVLSTTDSGSEATVLYSAGADAVLRPDMRPGEFTARLQAIERFLQLQDDWQRDRASLQQIANELALSHHRVEQVSLTDQLTELPNRRFAMQALGKAWNLGQRSNVPMTLTMLDLDHFKGINDVHGHAAGDEVLRRVARAMQQAMRREESVCRVGGEEFLIISSGTTLKQMLVAAERLRRCVEAITIGFSSRDIRPTVSVGVVQRSPLDSSHDDLLSAADKALYLAKHSGRNCVAFRHRGALHVLRSG